VDQLSIRRGTKKRDFCLEPVFHHGDFLETMPEKLAEMLAIMGSIPAHFSTQIPLPPQQTEVLLRQRL
jgi:hypothetical protein